MAEIVGMVSPEMIEKIKKEQDNKRWHAIWKRRQRFLQRQRNSLQGQKKFK